MAPALSDQTRQDLESEPTSGPRSDLSIDEFSTAPPNTSPTSRNDILENASETEKGPENALPSITYITGTRLRLITAALSLCLFLTSLEIPIVVTALVKITTNLGGFRQSSWIVAAYLLGYVGVLIVFAKLSDIFGRKTLLLVAIFLFVVFSAACGAAQTIQQLIVFRAFQGVGGAGNYSLCSVIFFELVPEEKYAKYTSSVSVVYSLSLLLGPIFGGAISQSSTWRWVFLLNVPPGALAGVILVFCLPNHFPYHGNSQNRRHMSGKTSFKQTFQRLDLVGSILLIIATLSLVAALLEASNEFPWKSAFVITLLTISGLCWGVFLLWEYFITISDGIQEPVFPWRFVQSRVWTGMLLNAVFLGGPWFAAIFQIPQRLTYVNGTSALQAGVRFMPFTLAAPVGSVLAPTIIKAAKIPPIYLVLVAATIQVVGFALISTLPTHEAISASQYGYEIIAGFGCGINITLLILMTPYSVQLRDKGKLHEILLSFPTVALGSVTQFRVMGGAIGLAIVTSVFNSFLRRKLGEFLTQDQIRSLLESADVLQTFPRETQTLTRAVIASGYNLQMKILAGLAGAQLLCTALMWQGKQIRV
ncbi:MFS general substrate transporter [Viridothelium virens]|uniref:MFS general substrate transporter n=1 Tax=Viridothelium virens TaxID=1048519 RepID=A0A6A6GWZ4_VIRVR|nr:MFS general substrate transporter [Viridothelium virens]